MEQDDLFNKPNDQELTAHAMMTTTTLTGDDPPTLRLIMDVTHDETGVGWRQAVTFAGAQVKELTELMVYSCKQIEVEWKEPNGSSETT